MTTTVEPAVDASSGRLGSHGESRTLGVKLHSCEPQFTQKRIVSLSMLVRELLEEAGSSPFLLAIVGRSSNGKTTLAARIAATTSGAAVVHTDDIAWWHSRFGWEDLLVSGVIEPLRRGDDVAYRPPAWDERGRPGQIRISAEAPLVVIEGVGAGRRSLAPLVDAIIWVQSDLGVTDERNAARVAAGELDTAGYEEWMAEEVPFQAEQRPWEHADVVVFGTPGEVHDPSTEVVVEAARHRAVEESRSAVVAPVPPEPCTENRRRNGGSMPTLLPWAATPQRWRRRGSGFPEPEPVRRRTGFRNWSRSRPTTIPSCDGWR